MSTAEAALRPLFAAATGVALACAGAALLPRPGGAGAPLLLLLLGTSGAAWALARSRRGVLLWLTLGLALGAGRALPERAAELGLRERLAAVPTTTVRVEGALREGWVRGRWGWRTTLEVAGATQRDEPLDLPRRLPLEVRGTVLPAALPPPGARVRALAGLRAPDRPLLVVASPQLLEVVPSPRRGLHHLRERCVASLLEAAGTEPQRLRAAELAGVLVLGRRDLVGGERRDRWRASGLAHVLAVSGLHVGLVAALLWGGGVVAGVQPVRLRLLLLVALPAYAALAGAAPSAVRATAMAAVYLAARLLGRAPLPLAAVLLVAAGMLLVEPRLIVDAGFQLTVVVTAALVRWVPPLARGRRWAALVLVPVVAQVAAWPLVAWHFRTMVPGAVVANLAAPLVVAPALAAGLAATALAPTWPGAAALALDLLGGCERLLLALATPARAHLLTAPLLPLPLAGALAAAGIAALAPHRGSRHGAAAWVALVALLGAMVALPRPPGPAARPLTLLPVSSGLALLAAAERHPLLVDAGSARDEAAELLADSGHRSLAALVLSHADEDHIGGAAEVIRRTAPPVLVLPRWMLADPAVVPLLRRARRAGTRVTPVEAGRSLTLDGARLEVLWPPVTGAPADDNDRSLVARLVVPGGVVLLTSDVSRAVERRLAERVRLACDVLVASHHGSRTGTSDQLLDAAAPALALVPAGAANRQHHPHPEVLAALSARGLPYRVPAHQGWCGARLVAGRWRPWP